VLQWVAHGTNTGAFPDGSPATGRKVKFPRARLIQVEGGKICLYESYFDRLGEHKQLGFRVSPVFARQKGKAD
jgi:predicted ester cyclase